MSKHSRKGFRKLENHELSEFATLQGDDESGSESEMMELAPERHSKRGGGACCWCVALYLLLLTCFIVLMAMVAMYFGYNVMRLSSDYSQRIRSLEDRVSKLENRLQSEETKSTDGMEKLSSQMSRVNGSVIQLDDRVRDHSVTMQGNLEEVKGDVNTLKIKVTAFESHPPTIGEEEVQEMRSGMAEFRSHLESYDSQLADVKRSAGDATHGVSQVNDKVLLLRRNVTTLRGSLSALQLDHTDTANSLDLLATQFSALQVVVQNVNETLKEEFNMSSINEQFSVLQVVVQTINETLREDFNVSRATINETRGTLARVGEKLSDITKQVADLNDDVEQLNTTLSQLAASQPSGGPPALPDEESETAAPAELTPENTEPPVATTQPTAEPPVATTQPAAEPPVATTQPTAEPPVATTQPTVEPSAKPETEHSTEPTGEATQTTTALIQAATAPTEPTVQATEAVTESTTQPTTKPLTESTTSSEPADVDEATPTEPAAVSTSDVLTTPSGDASTGVTSSDASSNQTSNEKGQTVSTPSSDQPLPVGTPVVADSTGATEDLPGSTGQESTGNAPEEQPPTVDNTHTSTTNLQQTIDTLQELLKSFYSLDINGNGSLDYYEFSSFTGDTNSARFAFEKMDGNSDRVLTQQELSRAVEMLEQQTTEGTEALPDSDTDVDSTKPVDSLLSTDTAEIQPVMPTGAPPDAGPSLYGEHSGRTDVTPDSETGDSETGPESDHSANIISNNLQRTVDQLEDIWKNFEYLDADENRALDYTEFSSYIGDIESAQYIFQRVDMDSDEFLTRQEILNAVSVLEQLISESTEAPPDSTDSDSASPSDNTNTSAATNAGTVTTNSSSGDPAVTLEPTLSYNTIDAETFSADSSNSDNDDNDVDEGATNQAQKALAMLSGVLMAFDTLDTNADDRLSSDEFSSYFGVTNAMMANIFSYLDADKDLYVTKQEMNDAVNSLESKAATPTPAATEVWNADSNFDDSESPEEQLKHYLNSENDNGNF